MLLSMCTTNKERSEVGYSGQDISGIASVKRDKDSKSAVFTIDAEEPWKLYSGLSPDGIDFSSPVLSGAGSGTFQLNVPDSVRSYFQLVTGKGRAALAERHLPMAGGYNFRDLGGFKTREGRFVKWGKIFRSDDLNKLTDADLGYLSSLPLVSVVDFRSEEERLSAPDKNPASVATNYSYSITPGNIIRMDALNGMNEEKADSAMLSIYVSLVTDAPITGRYKDYFALLQNEEKVPLLFHCSAGKDRTGLAAALTLLALGVDEETVMDDYFSSNVYLGDKYAGYIAKYPQLRSVFEVKKIFLQESLRQIKKEHGTVEAYLEEVLDVDIPHLRSLYLY